MHLNAVSLVSPEISASLLEQTIEKIEELRNIHEMPGHAHVISFVMMVYFMLLRPYTINRRWRTFLSGRRLSALRMKTISN